MAEKHHADCSTEKPRHFDHRNLFLLVALYYEGIFAYSRNPASGKTFLKEPISRFQLLGKL